MFNSDTILMTGDISDNLCEKSSIRNCYNIFHITIYLLYILYSTQLPR